MSILVLLELNAKPESAKELTNWLRNDLHHTRGFDGCNGITIHTNQNDTNNFVFAENWDSLPQYEKYLAFRTERGDIAKLVGWLVGEPSIRYFDNAGV